MFRNPTTDVIIVLVVVLLIFGPKRLPTLGRGLGQGLREFKDSITGHSSPSEDDEAERPALTTASPTEAAAPAAPVPERDSAEVGSAERRA
jgi:sec-independent protein translocase protein TatA